MILMEINKSVILVLFGFNWFSYVDRNLPNWIQIYFWRLVVIEGLLYWVGLRGRGNNLLRIVILNDKISGVDGDKCSFIGNTNTNEYVQIIPLILLILWSINLCKSMSGLMQDMISAWWANMKTTSNLSCFCLSVIFFSPMNLTNPSVDIT